MDDQQRELKRIIRLLTAAPDGMTITEVSKKLGIGRKSAARYLDMLKVAGEVRIRSFGRPRIYSVSGKIPLAAAMNLYPDLIVFVDDTLKVLEANELFLKYTGLERENLIGHSLEDTTIPHLLEPEILPRIREALQGKEYVIDIRIQEDEETCDYRVKLTPLTPGDVPPKVAIVYQDITARNKEVEALALARDYNRTIFEDFPAMIWSTGPDGKCNFVNRRWTEFTGRKQEEELGDSWLEGIHPEDLDRFVVQVQEAYDSLGRFELEYRLRHRTGEYRWISETGIPRYDQDGSFAGYIGYVYDLTERKSLEKALISAARFSGAVLDAVGAGIVVLDETGKIINTNEAWRRFARDYGASDTGKTGVGASYFEVCERAAGEAAQEAAEALEGLRAVMRGDRADYTREYACHSPEKKRWFTMKATRLDNAGIKGIVVIHTDITDRKLLEENIADCCDSLRLEMLKPGPAPEQRTVPDKK